MKAALQTALQSMIRGITHEKSMPVQICVGNESYTDHKMVQVAVTREELDNLSLKDVKNVLRFKALHETYHILWTDSKAFVEGKKSVFKILEAKAKELGVNPSIEIMNDFVGLLTNGLEDGRIENLGCYKFRGFKSLRDWYRLREWSMQEIKENSLSWMVLYNQILVSATMGIKIKGFDKYFGGSELDNLHQKCIKYISKGVLSKTTKECMNESEKIAEILAEFIVTEVPESPQITEEMKELLKNLLKQIAENNIQNRSNSCQKDGDSQIPEDVPLIAILTDDAENESGKDSLNRVPDIVIDLREKRDKEGKPESYVDVGDTRILSSNGTQSVNSLDVEETMGEIVSDISDEEMRELSERRMEEALSEVSTEEKVFDRELKEIESSHRQKIKKELSEEKKKEIASRHGNYKYLEKRLTSYKGFKPTPPPQGLINSTNTLKHQVENLLLAKAENDRSEVFEGDFDVDSIGKFVLGRFDVFKQEGTPFNLSMACTILKDNSGSMMGEKDFQCCKAGAMIEEVMKPLMPLRIADFNTYNGIESTIIKDFDDNENINYFWSYFQTNRPSGGNNDGYSIDMAANQLLLRPEENKLLVILSDGEPCCATEEVLQAVKSARKNGIFVVSFFFGNQDFLERSKDVYADMYEKYYIGVTPENIGKEFIKFLKIFVDTM